MSIHGMSIEELKTALNEVSKRVSESRIRRQTEQTRNTRLLRQLRQKKAVVTTILHGKQLGGEV